MEKPCNPQLNYRAAIRIYPVFPGPNFRLSLHPLWSPSTKEKLWTFYRQPPPVWGEHTWKSSILFPKVSNFWKNIYKYYAFFVRKSTVEYYYCTFSLYFKFISNTVNAFYIIGYIWGYL